MGENTLVKCLDKAECAHMPNSSFYCSPKCHYEFKTCPGAHTGKTVTSFLGTWRFSGILLINVKIRITNIKLSSEKFFYAFADLYQTDGETFASCYWLHFVLKSTNYILAKKGSP